MSQFRVSPWITYDPAPDARNEPLVRSNIHFSNMSDDVDMDAPQISTLREEETPEPQPNPARTSKFRVKLLVNQGKRADSIASNGSQKQAPESEDEDEDEEDEEEDQLIDDDDEDVHAAPVPPPAPPTAITRGLPVKRGGRGRGGGRKRGGRAGADATPKAGAQPQIGETSWEIHAVGTSSVPPVPIPVPAPVKKKGAPAKGATAQRAIRKRPSKLTKAPTILPQREDGDNVSEVTYPGTAASSPMPHDDHTPEPDIPVIPVAAAPSYEDSNLEGVPLPLYPLPNKPFPVQPAPKIGTGFAPIIPLDRSGKPVRRWRQVNREVRGIAGGRWFTRTWIGEKESEFASAAVAASAAAAHEREAALGSMSGAGGVALPRLPTIAMGGTSTGRGAGRGRGARLDTASSTASASRAGSAMPEGITAQIPRKRKASSLATPIAEVPSSVSESVI